MDITIVNLMFSLELFPVLIFEKLTESYRRIEFKNPWSWGSQNLISEKGWFSWNQELPFTLSRNPISVEAREFCPVGGKFNTFSSKCHS